MLIFQGVSNVMCLFSTEKRQSDALEMTSPQEIFNEILFCRVELLKKMTPNKATNLTTWVIEFHKGKNIKPQSACPSHIIATFFWGGGEKKTNKSQAFSKNGRVNLATSQQHFGTVIEYCQNIIFFKGFIQGVQCW